MTETPTTAAPKTKAQQIAELLGVELMPWQAAIFDAYLAGERLVHVGGRRGGRSTVRALADLADALRTPPAPTEPISWISPISWMLCEVPGRSLTEPYMSLPAMLTPDRPADPRMFSGFSWAEADDDGSLGGWVDEMITAACGALLDTYAEYIDGHVPACSICSGQPLVPNPDAP